MVLENQWLAIQGAFTCFAGACSWLLGAYLLPLCPPLEILFRLIFGRIRPTLLHTAHQDKKNAILFLLSKNTHMNQHLFDVSFCGYESNLFGAGQPIRFYVFLDLAFMLEFPVGHTSGVRSFHFQ